MARDPEAINRALTELIQAEARGRLLALGLARGMVWRDGVVPEGVPERLNSRSLTPDLLDFGYGILALALELRDANRERAAADQFQTDEALRVAAEAIESAVRRGDPNDGDQGRHLVISAAAFHLAGYAARSFSLLPLPVLERNLASYERCLAYLLRRDLMILRSQIIQWHGNSSNGDDAVASRLLDENDEFNAEDAALVALTTEYHRALGFADTALLLGDRGVFDSAVELLTRIVSSAGEIGNIPMWWVATLTLHLVRDLWDQSLHVVLPSGPNVNAPERWNELRRDFISLLGVRRPPHIDLWPSQIAAAKRAIDPSDDLVIALPTSAGKTRIAELCILRALADRIAGVIMQLAAHGRPEKKNLAAVREIIAGPEERLAEFAREALKGDNVFIKQKLAAFANEEAKNRSELSSIISTARRQTAFIGNTVISESLSGLDLEFGDLKRSARTVYVILPGDELTTCGTWFRLIVGCALNELWRGARGAFPVLAIVDEFAQIGRLAILESAMGMAAGYGVQIWPVLQDLTQLRKHYGDGWETFLSGAEIQQFFGPRDQFTADYVSKHAGVTTVMTTSTSRGSGSHSDSFNQAQQPLMHPHKIMGLGRDESIIFGPRNIVINARRRPYYHTPEFDALYNADPYHPASQKPSAEIIGLMEKDGYIYFDPNAELATIDARPHEWLVFTGWKDRAKNRFVGLTHKPTGLKFLVIPRRELDEKEISDLKSSNPRTDWLAALLEESRMHRLSRKLRGGRQSKATRLLGQAAIAWTLQSLGVLPYPEAERPPKNFIEALDYPKEEKIVLDVNGPKEILGEEEDWVIYYADNDIEKDTPFVQHIPSDLNFIIACRPSRQRFKLDPFNDCCALLVKRTKDAQRDAATIEAFGRSALLLYLVHVGAWGLVHEGTGPTIYLDPNDEHMKLTVGKWEDWSVQYIDSDIQKRTPVISHEPSGFTFAVLLLPGRELKRLDPFKDCYACLIKSSKEPSPDNTVVNSVGRNAIFVYLLDMNVWGFVHELKDPAKIYLNPDPEEPAVFDHSEWTVIQRESADTDLMRHDPTGCVFLINRCPSKSIKALDPFKDCAARFIEAPKPMPDEEKTELGRAAILAYVNGAQKSAASIRMINCGLDETPCPVDVRAVWCLKCHRETKDATPKISSDGVKWTHR